MEKGLLEKFHTEDNRKEIIVLVTEYGKRIYEQYSSFIYESHFKSMFEAGDAIPKEYLGAIAEMIKAGIREPERKVREKILIPVEKSEK